MSDRSASQLVLESPLVIDSMPFVAPDYLSLPPGSYSDIPAAHYERCVSRIPALSHRYFRVHYLSGGLKIEAIVGLPKGLATGGIRKYPVFVYNHGGNRDLDTVGACILRWLSKWAGTLGQAVVVASQYRGTTGSEGHDEFGGADVDDVLNVIEAAKGWPFVDAGNIFMMGWSRGGMMTYLALKKGVPVAAAVSVAGPTNLRRGEERRAEMKAVHAELMPGYRESRELVLSERSAVDWAEQINAPILIVHGTKDWRVSVEDALELGAELKRHGKEHRLVVYEGEGHGLDGKDNELLTELRDWFASHYEN